MTSRTSLIAVLALVLSVLSPRDGAASAVVGEAAPALAVKDLNGRPFDLHALAGKKPAIVVFWASWCPPCLAEIPVLSAFHRKHPEVALIALSVDRPREEEAARTWAKKMDYPTALMSAAEENGFGTPAVLPLTYVIGTSGTIRAIIDDAPVTEALLAAALKD